MKISCYTSKDFLPLYAEELLSKDSVDMVKNHLKDCGECSSELEDLKAQKYHPMDREAAPLKKIRRKIFYGKMKWSLLALLGSLVILILMISYVTAPAYLPFDQEKVQVIEGPDSAIYLQFSEEVAGYDLNRYDADGGGGYEYRITTWETLWSRIMRSSTPSVTVLNPEGDEVRTIYYYTADGELDRLIYGEESFSNGGSITLPRLALNYYLLLAGVLTILFLILSALLRKKPSVRGFFEGASMFFGAYVVSHGILLGINGSSYSMLRDFIGVLLLTIPVFMILILLRRIVFPGICTP